MDLVGIEPTISSTPFPQRSGARAKDTAEWSAWIKQEVTAQ